MASGGMAFLAVALGTGLALSGPASAMDYVVRFGVGEGPLGSSQAMRVRGRPLAHTAQVLATDASGKIVAADANAQALQAIRNLESALAAANSSLERIVRLNAVVRDAQAADALANAIGRFFPGNDKPTVTLVQGRLHEAEALLALDAIGVSTPSDMVASKTLWSRSGSLEGVLGGAHVATLPAGPRVYVSGRAADGVPSEAATDVLRQLDGTLEFLELQRSQIVQLKCFLHPISAARETASAIVDAFDGQAPPLVFVEWLNRQTIEIEAIVADTVARTSRLPRIEYITPPGLRSSPVFSRVARVSHPETIFVSTLNGRTANRGDLQIREMFDALSSILSQAGSDLRHLAKATYFVSDELTSTKLNEIRPEFYDPQRPPAASKASVRGTAVSGSQLAVDMIAVPSR